MVFAEKNRSSQEFVGVCRKSKFCVNILKSYWYWCLEMVCGYLKLATNLMKTPWTMLKTWWFCANYTSNTDQELFFVFSIFQWVRRSSSEPVSFHLDWENTYRIPCKTWNCEGLRWKCLCYIRFTTEAKAEVLRFTLWKSWCCSCIHWNWWNPALNIEFRELCLEKCETYKNSEFLINS